MDDLKTRLDYWLQRPDERSAIAQAAKSRAYAEHTYALRLSLLLDTLAGRAEGYPVPHIRWIQ